MTMSDTSWTRDPSLKGIDPQKLEVLLSIAESSKGKSPKELLPALLAMTGNLKRQGTSFSQEEADAVIQVLKQGKSPEEVQRMEKVISMMKFMGRQKH